MLSVPVFFHTDTKYQLLHLEHREFQYLTHILEPIYSKSPRDMRMFRDNSISLFLLE